MNAKLLVVLGKKTKREVALQLPAVLGRSRAADIKVAHPLVSRRHCEFSESNGLLMLRDLASLNGTMIGGRRIELAPLLPDSEFTIGPLTFRVLYEYGGDLESVPETRFVDAEGGPTEAGLGDLTSAALEEVPMLEVDEALPADSASESNLGELAMPDFMALADVDPGEVFPAAPRADILDEPLEVDSSLQSGGHRYESPWAVEPPPVEQPRGVPAACAGKGPPAAAAKGPPPAAGKGPPETPETPSDVTSDEKVVKGPAKHRPPAAKPPRRPTDSDDMDPEFGSFLEDLH